MIFVTKKVEFSAAHRLFNPAFSDEENDNIFDKCNNPNGHGHNYKLEITIAGDINPDTGYVIDLKLLKRIIDEEITLLVDHKHLNFDVPFLNGINPTVENICVAFWMVLKNKIPSGTLYKIKLWETDNNFAEYFG